MAKKSKTRATPEQIETAARMFANGMTTQEISIATGFAVRTIQSWAKRPEWAKVVEDSPDPSDPHADADIARQALEWGLRQAKRAGDHRAMANLAPAYHKTLDSRDDSVEARLATWSPEQVAALMHHLNEDQAMAARPVLQQRWLEQNPELQIPSVQLAYLTCDQIRLDQPAADRWLASAGPLLDEIKALARKEQRVSQHHAAAAASGTEPDADFNGL